MTPGSLRAILTESQAKGNAVQSTRHHMVVALVVATLALVAGCGGSDESSDESSDAAPAAADAPAAPSGDDDSSDGDDSSDESDEEPSPASSEIPEIAENPNWTGQLHVEVTGDVNSSFDADGTGATIDGFTNLAFPSNAGGATFGIGGELDPALALTVGTWSTTAALNNQCTTTFTKNDAGNLAADFDCPDLEGIDGATVKKASVKGNFTMTG
jgi:hypothetical protein